MKSGYFSHSKRNSKGFSLTIPNQIDLFKGEEKVPLISCCKQTKQIEDACFASEFLLK